MKAQYAILREYAGDGWSERLVSGSAVRDVERWVASIESRPRFRQGGAGKPLAWICLAVDSGDNPQNKKQIRAIGLQTDLLQALERSIAAEDLQALIAIFDKVGTPFTGILV